MYIYIYIHIFIFVNIRVLLLQNFQNVSSLVIFFSKFSIELTFENFHLPQHRQQQQEVVRVCDS